MKNSYILGFISIVFLVLSATPLFVSAHFEASDGSMTVVLHIEPNHDPQPGQQADLYFLINDATKKFNFSECNCTVSIFEGGKQIYQEQLTEKNNEKQSVDGIDMSYIFPKNDVYHIALIGNSTITNAFKPFSVSWDFRVDPKYPGIVPQQYGPSDVQIIWGVILGGSIVLVLLGIFVKKAILDAEL